MMNTISSLTTRCGILRSRATTWMPSREATTPRDSPSGTRWQPTQRSAAKSLHYVAASLPASPWKISFVENLTSTKLKTTYAAFSCITATLETRGTSTLLETIRHHRTTRFLRDQNLSRNVISRVSFTSVATGPLSINDREPALEKP